MKNNLLFFIILFLISSNLFSQSRGKGIGLDDEQDSSLIDSLYGENTWNTYFKSQETKYGNVILLKLIDDSSYCIQWGNSSKLKTFPEKFNLDGHESWIPRLISENKDYLVLRQSCGNPCWVGYFLPLNDEVKPQMFHEYLDFDLENHLVAYVNENSDLEIMNLKTSKKEIHKIQCSSAFIGYCIDKISMKNKKLRIKLRVDPADNSGKSSVRTEKIKI